MPDHIKYPIGEQLVNQSYGDLVTDRFGLSSATAEWWYYGGNPAGQIGIRSAHPLWPFMHVDRRTIRHVGAYWQILADYFGVDGNPEPVYTLSLSLSSEPVETHKNFSQFGTDANGATFDENGGFEGFLRRPAPPKADEAKLNASAAALREWYATHPVTNTQWVGVRDYLSPGATWTETRVTSSKPSNGEISQLGRIDNPNGNAPTPSGRNWLFSGLSFDQKAKTYTVRREWTLSGPRGWNPTLY